MCCMIVFTLSTTLLHVVLHGHCLSQRTIEVVVVDVIEYLVLPTEVESAEVILLQKIVAILVYSVVKLLFVILIEGNADPLQQMLNAVILCLCLYLWRCQTCYDQNECV